MMTLLPSTLLELYEMYSLAKVQSIALHELNIMEHFLSIAFMFLYLQVLNHKVSSDMDSLAKRASHLSSQFGDRFVSDYTEKIKQIEQECIQAMRMKQH